MFVIIDQDRQPIFARVAGVVAAIAFDTREQAEQNLDAADAADALREVGLRFDIAELTPERVVTFSLMAEQAGVETVWIFDRQMSLAEFQAKAQRDLDGQN